MAATLVFKIIGDASQAQSTLGKVTGTLEKMKGPALAAGAAITAGLGYAVSAASDAEQAFGAMAAVFGDNTAAMSRAAQSANALGLSTAQYNQAAAITGALLRNTGTGADELAGKTEGLIGAASDMAAQFGGPTSAALDAISSAIKGNFEMMDNYGVKMTAADVTARAMADGSTQAEAAIALMNEQLAQTGTAGAAAREMDSFASQTATARAAVEDAAASIGSDLLPYLADLAGKLKEGAAWMAEHEDAVRNAAIAIGVFSAAILAANTAIKTAQTVMAVYNGILAAVKFAQLVAATAGYVFAGAEMAVLWPIALIVAGIVALIAIIVLLVKNWDKVYAVMKKLYDWYKSAFIAVWSTIADAIQKVIDVVKKLWDWIQKILGSGIEKIAGWFGKMKAPAGEMAAGAATLTAGTTAGGRATVGGVGPTIVFNGIVTDPESTARAIRRVLNGSDARRGWQTGTAAATW